MGHSLHHLDRKIGLQLLQENSQAGAHNALVQFSATWRTFAVSLYKIAHDIRQSNKPPSSVAR
jgi:fumarate hydratase class II